jgi:hypothetical protein
MKLILSLFVVLSLCLAQTPVRLTDGASNSVISGATGTNGIRYDSGPITITTGGLTITSVKTAVQAIHCNTINATASTVTLTDGNSVVYWNAVAITANGILFEQFGAVGMSFAGGVKLTAGTGSALSCQVVGVQ